MFPLQEQHANTLLPADGKAGGGANAMPKERAPGARHFLRKDLPFYKNV